MNVTHAKRFLTAADTGLCKLDQVVTLLREDNPVGRELAEDLNKSLVEIGWALQDLVSE